MTNNSYDFKKNIVRVTATLIALIAVLYFANIWFFKQNLQPTIRVISWQDAAKHYGENVTVEGTIVVTHNSGKACFLNFHPDYKRYFSAVIFASVFSSFPSIPENYYKGKRVRISGYIKEYKGKPEVILNNPSQIEILE